MEIDPEPLEGAQVKLKSERLCDPGKGAIAGDATQAAALHSLSQQIMQPTMASYAPPPPAQGLVGSAPTLSQYPFPLMYMPPLHSSNLMGMQPGIQPGMQPGMQLGMQPGMQPGFHNQLTPVDVQRNPFSAAPPFYPVQQQSLMQPPQPPAAPAAPKPKQGPRICKSCNKPQKGTHTKEAGTNKWICPNVGLVGEFQRQQAGASGAGAGAE